MKGKKLILGLFFIMASVSCGIVFAQEAVDNVAVEESAAQQPAVENVVADDLTPEWLWGEVISVDPTLNQFVVKHMDYDSYEEVKTTLTIDDKTMFENAQDLSHVLAGDHVTVDYKVKGGVSVVELVVVEKPLPQDEENIPLATDAQPKTSELSE